VFKLSEPEPEVLFGCGYSLLESISYARLQQIHKNNPDRAVLPAEYTESLPGRHPLLGFLKRRGKIPGLTGIAIMPHGVCAVRVSRRPDRSPEVGACEYRAWDSGQDREAVLVSLRRELSLDASLCSLVLDETEYSLVLTDAPEVPPAELRSAVRWRVRDLIDFSVDDAVLDVFDVPGESEVNRARSLYAVAARKSAVQQHIDLLTAAGIAVSIIDIPEMTQRNIAALLEDDERGVLMLSFGAQSGLVTITRRKEIYLARRLDIGIEALGAGDAPAAEYDRVVLEIQRSLDYFDSYFRQSPIASVALGPEAARAPGLLEHLQASLNAIVRGVDPATLLAWRQRPPPALHRDCLGALGAALREEPGQ
jgi:MSHA biogenesis protein MshI